MYISCNSFYVRVSTMTAIDGRSQIKVHTDERTHVHTAHSTLVITHPSTNRGSRALTSVNVLRSNSLGRHPKHRYITIVKETETCSCSDAQP